MVAVLVNVCQGLMLLSIVGLIIFIVKKRKKLIFSFLGASILFFILTGVLSLNSQTKTATTNPALTQNKSHSQAKGTTTKETVKKPPVKKEVATTKPKPTAKQQVETASKAQQAKETVAKFDKVINEYNKVYNQFAQVVTNLSKGSDPNQALDQLQAIDTNALNVFTDATVLSVPKPYQADQETLKIVVSDLQVSISDMQKYIKGHNSSDMSDAERNLKQAQSGLQTLNMAIAQQAISDGYDPSKS